VYRDIWIPSGFVGDDTLKLEITNTEVVVNDKTTPIARWIDWTDGQKEMEDANLPPSTGQCLMVKRNLIDSYTSKFKSRFCWIWRLTGYQREYSYQEYKTFSIQGQIGASNVILA
jgi:hypothetical protein